MALHDAENKIAGLRDKEAGLVRKEDYLTIEEIVNKVNEAG